MGTKEQLSEKIKNKTISTDQKFAESHRNTSLVGRCF